MSEREELWINSGSEQTYTSNVELKAIDNRESERMGKLVTKKKNTALVYTMYNV